MPETSTTNATSNRSSVGSIPFRSLGGPRVVNTTGQMGIAAVYAAAFCQKHSTNPRGVYDKHIDELRELAGYGND